MAKTRRGGYRQPNKPAAVATPQGGQRTDGGPGSKKQPLRRLPDADYGQNKAFVEQQQAAPLPMQNAMPVTPNVFAPTERPGEPATQGVPIGQGSGPVKIQDNTDTILEAIYQINPSPVILEIINNRQA
tara:strand:- start:153 stop:539 length:387 start_codon:yes stop_codon:yes gene_type:complete